MTIGKVMKTRLNSSKVILNRISAIREEPDINERIKMLQRLNNLLPLNKRIEMPSLITNAYIRRALDIIHERTMALS